MTDLIIIEGVDGVGKSELARQIYETDDHMAMLHAGPPRQDDAYQEYVAPLVTLGLSYTIICDRWHLGELVWPYVFGREPLYTFAQLPAIEHAICSMVSDVCLVYMQADEAHLRAITDGRRQQSWEQIDQARALYWTALQHTTMKVIHADHFTAYREVMTWKSSQSLRRKHA